MTQTLIWLILAGILVVVEVMTVDLVSIWVACGCLVAALMAYFKLSITYQLVAILVVSIALGIITRPYCKKLLRGNITPTNSDRLIGKIATVTKLFDGENRGEVKVLGEHWTCISKDKNIFNEGDQVKVQAIEGVKLIVTKK